MSDLDAMTATVEEHKARAAFEGSQRRRQRIGMVVGAVVIAGLVGARLYQAHLRESANARLELKVEMRAAP